ncbi:acyl-CoA dehydrogenase NM domain-like protein [Hygrophoropsis aurantiaca]|uniref:Acyl-CoA dehydrogenase NM domain-like protein n=1 Tax=Hygrophoropsis aurantiaca TaxID=72124 RepID=A0ACB8A5Z0_9AGAM|nr:acyl-CoA dehydrogenase NM domain-like protein [Hygrophoropsis aurantiaca]
MPATSTTSLPHLPIFQVHAQDKLLPQQEATLSFQRAKQIAAAYSLTDNDIRSLSPAFWNMHADPITCLDFAATTLLTIQLNLAAGTVATYVREQPHLRTVLDDLLRFDVSGQFCLTELDHGLDAINIETTATLLEDGGFELHTPHFGASKFMPPTVPCGIPTVAVVFAKLLVEGNNCGIRPFLVQLNDGTHMCPGVSAHLLPSRRAPKHINHSITSFNRVRLPNTALLGGITGSGNYRLDFFQAIWRVAVGTMSLAAIPVSSLQIAAFIAGRYSQRRTVVGTEGQLIPLISFRTQHAPILIALAQSFVLKEFWRYATSFFSDQSNDPRVRHAIAAALKAIFVQHGQTANLALSDRCGAQGLFDHNQICTLHAEIRGIAIAEGDILALSIRLSTELLLERYEMPKPVHSSSLLFRHEDGLLSENREILARIGAHRSAEYESLVLPHAEKIVQSIGHRMAYDTATLAGLDPRITDLYQISSIRLDEAWYVENAGFSRSAQFEAEDKAIRAAMPLLDTWLEDTGIQPYIRAPIVCAERWATFVEQLDTFSGIPVVATSINQHSNARL